MTRDEISDLMALIAEEHPKFVETPNPKKRLDLWEEAFSTINREIVEFAVKRTLIETPYVPRLADIVSRVKEILRPEGDDVLTAWSILHKAAGRASVVSLDEYNALPYEVKRFCGSLRGLRDLGQLDTEIFNTVTRGHFFKVYDSSRRSRETQEMLPESVRTVINEITKILGMPEGLTPTKANRATGNALTLKSPESEIYEPMSEAEWNNRRNELMASFEGTIERGRQA